MTYRFRPSFTSAASAPTSNFAFRAGKETRSRRNEERSDDADLPVAVPTELGWVRMDGVGVWSDTVLSLYSDGAERAVRARCFSYMGSANAVGGISKYDGMVEGVSGRLSPMLRRRSGAERDEPDADVQEVPEWDGRPVMPLQARDGGGKLICNSPDDDVRRDGDGASQHLSCDAVADALLNREADLFPSSSTALWSVDKILPVSLPRSEYCGLGGCASSGGVLGDE